MVGPPFLSFYLFILRRQLRAAQAQVLPQRHIHARWDALRKHANGQGGSTYYGYSGYYGYT